MSSNDGQHRQTVEAGGLALDVPRGWSVERPEGGDPLFVLVGPEAAGEPGRISIVARRAPWPAQGPAATVEKGLAALLEGESEAEATLVADSWLGQGAPGSTGSFRAQRLVSAGLGAVLVQERLFTGVGADLVELTVTVPQQRWAVEGQRVLDAALAADGDARVTLQPLPAQSVYDALTAAVHGSFL